MAALPVFRQIGTIADAEFVAIEVLPAVWAFALGPLLDLNQFKNYMALIKELSAKIEQEQIRKLREISADSRSADSSDLNDIISLPQDNSLDSFGDSSTGMDDDFANLVLGRSSSKQTSESLGNTVLGSSSSFLSPSSQNTSSATGFTELSSSTGSLRAQNLTQLGSSRSITPDYGMSTFVALKPANTPTPSVNPLSSTMQPLQPSAPGAGNASSYPRSYTSGGITGNQSMDYSSFKLNIPNSNANIQQTRSNSSNIFPSSEAGSNGAYSAFVSNPGSNTASSNINFPNASSAQSGTSYPSFSIPPPNAASNLSIGATGGNVQGPGPMATSFSGNPKNVNNTPKQGLEKYESLL